MKNVWSGLAGVLVSAVVSTSAFAQQGGSPPLAYGAPPPAYAQPESQEAQGPDRSGFTVELGVGIGMRRISHGDDAIDDGGMGTHFALGGWITPRFAVLYNNDVVFVSQDGAGDRVILAQGATTGMVKLVVGGSAWLKAGVGVGGETTIGRGTRGGSGLVPAVTAGGGVELSQTRSGAIDLSLSLTAAFHQEATMTSVSALLGYNWF